LTDQIPPFVYTVKPTGPHGTYTLAEKRALLEAHGRWYDEHAKAYLDARIPFTKADEESWAPGAKIACDELEPKE
jgi:hypothetical protein